MDNLLLYTVYDHPLDYPDHFVARKFIVAEGRTVVTSEVFTATTLEELRAQIPSGLVAIGRSDDDDPTIVEVWL